MYKEAIKPRVVAVILAAGRGKRLDASLPKQLLKIKNRYVVNYCLDIYQNLEMIDSIVLVINDEFRSLFETIVHNGGYSKVESIVAGGYLRQDSIFNGLATLKGCDLVVIQNAVSIFTPPKLIVACIEKALHHGAVSAFVREKYSSFTFEGDALKAALDRRLLGHVRDPQVFDFNLLFDAHKKARRGKEYFTNDVLLLSASGHDVHLVESNPYNFKITFDVDIKLAHLLLEDPIFCRKHQEGLAGVYRE
ncbi:MAG: 2-C-methyl-D-erythritol 4-phosphate cytidylyltransferase [Candidatus Omnitrophota bacterium]|nr:MAG: 2-C-methyl-D-erythritol 4-phosphate cytidylyltransferase [Candidatus Omnitrophota bacterium]